MKFLVMERFKQGLIVTPEIAKIEVKALNWYGELIKQGKIDRIYNFTGDAGGFVIMDVKSNEELQEIIMKHPLFPYLDRQVIPITEQAVASKAFKEFAASISAEK